MSSLKRCVENVGNIDEVCTVQQELGKEIDYRLSQLAVCPREEIFPKSYPWSVLELCGHLLRSEKTLSPQTY